MGRARGSDATMQLGWEDVYGTPPTTGHLALPFVSTSLGATQGLLESDLLGQGRNPFDPTQDVIVNVGDVVVPLDAVYFGLWLRMLLGEAETTGSAAPYTHVFNNNQSAQSSASIVIGHPRVPSYSVNYGVVANTLRIQQQRAGLVNATIGCIAKGETTPAPTNPAGDSVIGSQVSRFAQAGGAVLIDGATAAGIVDASFSYTNNLDTIETIRADKEIEGADLGMPAATGQFRARFADNSLLNKAISGTPVSLQHRFSLGAYSITFIFDRVFLPRPKRTIDGPGGIMASFDWQGSGSLGTLMSAVLVSPQPFF